MGIQMRETICERGMPVTTCIASHGGKAKLLLVRPHGTNPIRIAQGKDPLFIASDLKHETIWDRESDAIQEVMDQAELWIEEMEGEA